MSTRRAGEGLRASSHFSDNSIESSVRGLTLGGGSGLYRGSRPMPIAFVSFGLFHEITGDPEGVKCRFSLRSTILVAMSSLA